MKKTTNRKIEIRAGYYEILLYVDGKPYYSFGDILDYGDRIMVSHHDLSAYCDELSDYVREQYYDEYYDDEEHSDFLDGYKDIGALTQEEISIVEKKLEEFLQGHFELLPKIYGEPYDSNTDPLKGEQQSYIVWVKNNVVVARVDDRAEKYELEHAINIGKFDTVYFQKFDNKYEFIRKADKYIRELVSKEDLIEKIEID